MQTLAHTLFDEYESFSQPADKPLSSSTYGLIKTDPKQFKKHLDQADNAGKLQILQHNGFTLFATNAQLVAAMSSAGFDNDGQPQCNQYFIGQNHVAVPVAVSLKLALTNTRQSIALSQKLVINLIKHLRSKKRSIHPADSSNNKNIEWHSVRLTA